MAKAKQRIQSYFDLGASHGESGKVLNSKNLPKDSRLRDAYLKGVKQGKIKRMTPKVQGYENL